MTAWRKPSSGSAERKRASTVRGVITAPKAVPLWKIEFPSERSSGGRTARVVRMPQGQLPASNNPRAKRQANSIQKCVAKPVNMPASDQPNTMMG